RLVERQEILADPALVSRAQSCVHSRSHSPLDLSDLHPLLAAWRENRRQVASSPNPIRVSARTLLGWLDGLRIVPLGFAQVSELAAGEGRALVLKNQQSAQGAPGFFRRT